MSCPSNQNKLQNFSGGPHGEPAQGIDILATKKVGGIDDDIRQEDVVEIIDRANIRIANQEEDARTKRLVKAGIDHTPVHVSEITDVERIKNQDKTVAPGVNVQTIRADNGYTGLGAVTVQGDADLVAGNIVVGKTVFGVEGAFKGLTGIVVTTPPTKTEYIAGEALDSEGMVITASYANADDAAIENYTVAPAALATTDTKVTISYTEHGITKTVEQAVSVKALASIAITTPPTDVNYVVGETFAPAGMVVTATYTDASTAAVTNYTTAPTAALALTDEAITVTYVEGGITKTATQAITVTAE